MPIFFTIAVASCATLPSPVWAQGAKLDTPKRIYNGPVYPEKLIKKNAMGHVEIMSDIDTTGRNVNCHVVSSTNSDFNESALEYCRRERYAPATKAGVPIVERNHRMIMNFKLDN